jgi:CheY-like chemotaxis protein
VAKILVADDNSNIQKMVGLALKDQGIDVVAVGNGEAAVRKISDVRPDLVLADVFMPVRNGYEVCNYVKQDSALSHIPVILLVGAFDPLDEQEAQRVGADGVLKKPFVPPDPLISMVKSALTRAGVVLGAPESAAPQTQSFAKPEPSPLARVAPAPPVSEPEPDLSLTSLPARPAPFTIAKGSEPLAFGNLLETPAPEEEAAFPASSGAAAPERDWGKNEVQEEEQAEEVESPTDSWRVSSMDEIPDEAPAGQTDWREAAFAGIETEKDFKQWAPSVEKNSLSITEEEAAELAKTSAPELPPSSGIEDWSKAINSIFPEKPQPPDAELPIAPTPAESAEPVQTAAVEPQPAPQISEPVVSEPAPVLAASPEAPAPDAAPGLNSWMAGAVSPWEAELQRAGELTSTWDSAQVAPAGVAEDTQVTDAFLDSGLMAVAHEHIVETIEEVKAETALQPAEAEPSATATAESLYSPPEHGAEAERPAASLPPETPALATEVADQEAPAAPVPDPAADHMDELVARVLAKMNPEVLQAVTREILKPVVEALVKDELNRK